MVKQLLIKLANGNEYTRELPDDAVVIYTWEGTPIAIVWGDSDNWSKDSDRWKSKIFLGTGMLYWEIVEVDRDG